MTVEKWMYSAMVTVCVAISSWCGCVYKSVYDLSTDHYSLKGAITVKLDNIEKGVERLTERLDKEGRK